MTKVAKLVYYSFVTRVIVDENATEEEIIQASKTKMLDKVKNELGENIEEIIDDEECPISEGDVYFQPDFGNDDELITPDGIELWSYYVYSTKELAQADFPDREILEFSGDDIYNPYFVK
jgi:hypothetical protein